jgi:C2 domain
VCVSLNTTTLNAELCILQSDIVTMRSGNCSEKRKHYVPYNSLSQPFHHYIVTTFCLQVFTYEITNPDVAVLNLQVFDEDITSSDFIGFSALPVSCLRNGLRTVGLFNKNGFREREYGFATLFLRISVEPLDGSPMPTKQHSILSSRNSKSYFKSER